MISNDAMGWGGTVHSRVQRIKSVVTDRQTDRLRVEDRHSYGLVVHK